MFIRLTREQEGRNALTSAWFQNLMNVLSEAAFLGHRWQAPDMKTIPESGKLNHVASYTFFGQFLRQHVSFTVKAIPECITANSKDYGLS